MFLGNADLVLYCDRRIFPNKEKDACQVVGTLEINKVAGNFHITAGESSSSQKEIPRSCETTVMLNSLDHSLLHLVS